MFPEGTEVVDRILFAEGHAAIGIVRSSTVDLATVEWPDGQEESVPNNELLAVRSCE